MGASVLALLPLWFWSRALRLRRLIQDLPTSKARGVFIGLVELKGTAEIEEPLTSYLAETACVQFGWSVSEEGRRVVTYTVTDKDGNSRTETRVESGWTTVASGGLASPFHLVDDTGSILVRPEGATIEGRSVFSETVTAFSDLYYGKGPPGGVVDSTGRRMFTESAVPLHAPVFVVGKARQREDVVAAEIAADPSAPMFLISTRSEEQVAGGHGWTIWLTGLLVLALPAGGWAIDRNQMGPADWPDLLPAGWFSLGASGVLLVAWLWQVFNSMTDLRNRVRQASSLVDIQLKRRNDLIPELVRVVEAARAHEAGA
ncbi:MAG: GIDE domain-containing protein, partial [Solirubrobacterales bacterium]